MQNVPRHCHTKNDSNSYQTFYGTPVVGNSTMESMPSVMFYSKRRPWFLQFRIKLGQCTSLDEVEALLRVKVRQWRGLTDLSMAQAEGKGAVDEDTAQGDDLTGILAEDELPDSYSMLELEK
jgi:hypothetical protein